MASRTDAADQTEWERWFQGVWAEREEKVYPRLFGSLEPKVATVPRELFVTLGFPQADPRWLVHGVLTSPPQPDRPNWLYVTTSLSNPWGIDPGTVDRRRPSGLGMELLIQTTQPAPWAITVLHWLTAVQILCASGLLKGEMLGYGDRVPLGRPIDPHHPEIDMNSVFVLPPDAIDHRVVLPSGTVDLLLCVGVTDPEWDFAKKRGNDALWDLLRARGAYPTTDPTRASLV